MIPTNYILYDKIPTLSQEEIRHIEATVPLLAQIALRKAFIEALDSGEGVLQIDLEGNLVEHWKDVNIPDRFIKKLEPAYKIEIGSTRIRNKT